MMKMRRAGLVLLLVLVAGCAHRRQVEQTGTDHVSGWSDQTRATAREAFIFAQMSSSAYADERRFIFPEGIEEIEAQPNDKKGFAYSVYRINNAAAEPRIIIAYRGTEDAKDWWHGNFLGKQNKRGLRVYKQWRAKTGAGVPIVVTGHSLGGGIALHVSLREADTPAYVFNTSPRFWKNGAAIDNDRHSIVENGEVLKLGRLPGSEATQTYTSLNCTKRVGSVTQHSMRRLAECLTQIAAFETDAAGKSLVANKIPFPNGLPPE